MIQRYYEGRHSVRECQARFGFSSASWTSAAKRGVVLARATAMPVKDLLAAPRHRGHLKSRLTKARLLPSICRDCAIQRWRDKPLALELHHLNGERKDTRLSNLALLCPNCHSQTDTWGARNASRGRLSPAPPLPRARKRP